MLVRTHAEEILLILEGELVRFFLVAPGRIAAAPDVFEGDAFGGFCRIFLILFLERARNTDVQRSCAADAVVLGAVHLLDCSVSVSVFIYIEIQSRDRRVFYELDIVEEDIGRFVFAYSAKLKADRHLVPAGDRFIINVQGLLCDRGPFVRRLPVFQEELADRLRRVVEIYESFSADPHFCSCAQADPRDRAFAEVEVVRYRDPSAVQFACRSLEKHSFSARDGLDFAARHIISKRKLTLLAESRKGYSHIRIHSRFRAGSIRSAHAVTIRGESSLRHECNGKDECQQNTDPSHFSRLHSLFLTSDFSAMISVLFDPQSDLRSDPHTYPHYIIHAAHI